MSGRYLSRNIVFLLIGGMVLAAPEAVAAHGNDGQATFVSGMLHPLTGIDHVAAMVAVGLWGAQLHRPAMWALPMAFPLVMAVGAALAIVGVRIPAPELGISVSAAVLGAAILFRFRPRLGIAVALVALSGLFHGYAHGAELPPGASPIDFSIGFVISTAALHLAGIGLGFFGPDNVRDHVARMVGALVLIAGVAYFAKAVT